MFWMELKAIILYLLHLHSTWRHLKACIVYTHRYLNALQLHYIKSFKRLGLYHWWQQLRGCVALMWTLLQLGWEVCLKINPFKPKESKNKLPLLWIWAELGVNFSRRLDSSSNCMAGLSATQLSPPELVGGQQSFVIKQRPCPPVQPQNMCNFFCL